MYDGPHAATIFKEYMIQLLPCADTDWNAPEIQKRLIAGHVDERSIAKRPMDLYVLAVHNMDYHIVTNEWLGENSEQCRISDLPATELKDGRLRTSCFVFGFVHIRRRDIERENHVRKQRILQVELMETNVSGYQFGYKMLQKLERIAKTEKRTFIIEDPIDRSYFYWLRPEIFPFLKTVTRQLNWEEYAKDVAHWKQEFIEMVKQRMNQ